MYVCVYMYYKCVFKNVQSEKKTQSDKERNNSVTFEKCGCNASVVVVIVIIVVVGFCHGWKKKRLKWNEYCNVNHAMISFVCVCVFVETNQMFIPFRLFSEHKVLTLRLFFRCRFIYFASLPIFAIGFDHAIEKRVQFWRNFAHWKRLNNKTTSTNDNCEYKDERDKKKSQILKKRRVGMGAMGWESTER